jgi:hypothetical protein
MCEHCQPAAPGASHIAGTVASHRAPDAHRRRLTTNGDEHALARCPTAGWTRDGDASTSTPSDAFGGVSQYDIDHVDIYVSARKHGIADEDIAHAVGHAVAAGEQDDGKVLYLGPDRAGNLLEVVAVVRVDGSEIVIHAMTLRPKYAAFLRSKGETNG